MTMFADKQKPLCFAAWFEEAVAEPQVVLQDLISAFWGTNTTHTFFRNIAQASCPTPSS